MTTKAKQKEADTAVNERKIAENQIKKAEADI